MKILILTRKIGDYEIRNKNIKDIMDYEKKYKEALKRAEKLYERGTITESIGFIWVKSTERR